jgi:hypothetical protein
LLTVTLIFSDGTEMLALRAFTHAVAMSSSVLWRLAMSSSVLWLLDAEFVGYRCDAVDPLGRLLGLALLPVRRHMATEGNDALLDRNTDVVAFTLGSHFSSSRTARCSSLSVFSIITALMIS